MKKYSAGNKQIEANYILVNKYSGNILFYKEAVGNSHDILIAVFPSSTIVVELK